MTIRALSFALPLFGLSLVAVPTDAAAHHGSATSPPACLFHTGDHTGVLGPCDSPTGLCFFGDLDGNGLDGEIVVYFESITPAPFLSSPARVSFTGYSEFVSDVGDELLGPAKGWFDLTDGQGFGCFDYCLNIPGQPCGGGCLFTYSVGSDYRIEVDLTGGTFHHQPVLGDWQVLLGHIDENTQVGEGPWGALVCI